MKEQAESMLNPYRVLDLTDEKGWMCGKLLADLGADVIKIEKPGGDPGRNIGPFYHDEPDPENCLLWWAFNAGKRGVTLSLDADKGRDIFRKLVEKADFVIESFTPGYLEKLGLGYCDLEKINPKVIVVSITPFGQTGPYMNFKTTDAVSWAMGGQMYLWGDPDRPPIRISHHSHAYLHAASQAVVGALLALHYLHTTGEGQHVDVSIQESVAYMSIRLACSWDMMKTLSKREKINLDISVLRNLFWPCKDGQVNWLLASGLAAQRTNQALTNWMADEGMADSFLMTFDWTTFDLRTTTQEIVDCIEAQVGRFFRSHTIKEILEGTTKYRTFIQPVSTTKDILENDQLISRDFWEQIEHPELNTFISYPGTFVKASKTSNRTFHRAPLIAEHNVDVYCEEMGISTINLTKLQQNGII